MSPDNKIYHSGKPRAKVFMEMKMNWSNYWSSFATLLNNFKKF